MGLNDRFGTFLPLNSDTSHGQFVMSRRPKDANAHIFNGISAHLGWLKQFALSN